MNGDTVMLGVGSSVDPKADRGGGRLQSEAQLNTTYMRQEFPK